MNEFEIVPHEPGGDTGKSCYTNLNSGFFRVQTKEVLELNPPLCFRNNFHIMCLVGFHLTSSVPSSHLPNELDDNFHHPHQHEYSVPCKSERVGIIASLPCLDSILRGKLYLLTQSCSHSASLIYTEFLIPQSLILF